MKRRKGPFPWWNKTRKGYARYIESPEWAAFRERYYRTHDKRCFVVECGSTESIRLHHINYRRIGNERPTDVVPLCAFHHKEVHLLINRGVPLRSAHLQLRGGSG